MPQCGLLPPAHESERAGTPGFLMSSAATVADRCQRNAKETCPLFHWKGSSATGMSAATLNVCVYISSTRTLNVVC